MNVKADTAARKAPLVQLASQLVGAPTNVMCSVGTSLDQGETQPILDEAGELVGFEPTIWLAPSVCNGVRDLLKGRYHDVEGDQIETLLHESLHIRLNTENEGLVDCLAMHQVWPFLTRLGIRGTLRLRMIRSARWWHEAAPPIYRKVC